VDYNSVKNQEIKRRFVEREVYYCVSHLVHELSQKADCILDAEDYDNLTAVLSKPDYEAAVESNGECHVQYSQKLGGFVWVNKETHEVSEPFGTYEEACQDCVEANDLDYDYVEAYEHWLVSDWLAGRLRAHGEMVGRVLGLTIWGRTTTGQAIYMDWVISKICEELEILEGQENEWKM